MYEPSASDLRNKSFDFFRSTDHGGRKEDFWIDLGFEIVPEKVCGVVALSDALVSVLPSKIRSTTAGRDA